VKERPPRAAFSFFGSNTRMSAQDPLDLRPLLLRLLGMPGWLFGATVALLGAGLYHCVGGLLALYGGLRLPEIGQPAVALGIGLAHMLAGLLLFEGRRWARLPLAVLPVASYWFEYGAGGIASRHQLYELLSCAVLSLFLLYYLHRAQPALAWFAARQGATAPP
jgi:hypothetical protein